MYRALLAASLVTGLVSQLAADEPTSAYIFPAGAQRGTEVQVRVGGHFFHGEADFEILRGKESGIEYSPTVREMETIWFEGPVIPQPASQRKEDYPRDHAATLKIAADAPLGVRTWRVSTSQGVTAGRPFVIGDLPEIVEAEVDGPATPVPVKFPITINGRVFPREDVDCWRIEAQKGQTIWCEVESARLATPLDARLEVIGPGGVRIAENTDYFGADPFLAFTAPVAGAYDIRIHDINFGGLQDYVYRLTVSDGPYVELTYPLGGQRGSEVAVELLGVNVADKPVTLNIPADAPADWQQQANVAGTRTNAFYLATGDLPEALESEPNDQPEQAIAVSLPVVANGRIGAAADVDTWSFTANSGSTYEAEIFARRLGSPIDAVLKVVDAAGKQLAKSGSQPGSADPKVTFKAQADGPVYVQVAESFSTRGGPRFAYRLQLGEGGQAEPDFQVTFPLDAVTVLPGGKTLVQVDVARGPGVTGKIDLEIPGLPEGVTFKPNSIGANRPNQRINIEATEDAPVGRYEVEIIGVTKVPEKVKKGEEQQEIRRPAVLNLGRGRGELDRFTIAVGMKAPFTIVGEFASEFAGQGTTQRKTYRIERDGYDGPITVRLADRQARHLQGVTGPTIVVPAGATEFEYAVQLPPWLDEGRTSRTCIMGMAEVKDAQGRKQMVSYSSQNQNEQIVVLAAPNPISVEVHPESLLAQPGGSTEVSVRVARAAEARLPLDFALVVPEGSPWEGLITSEPLRLGADEASGTLRIQFAKELPTETLDVRLRGIGHRGEDTYLSDAIFEVVPLSEVARP